MLSEGVNGVPAEEREIQETEALLFLYPEEEDLPSLARDGDDDMRWNPATRRFLPLSFCGGVCSSRCAGVVGGAADTVESISVTTTGISRVVCAIVEGCVKM